MTTPAEYSRRRKIKKNKRCIDCGVLIKPTATRCHKCEYKTDIQYKTKEERIEANRRFYKESDKRRRKPCPDCGNLMYKDAKYCRNCYCKYIRGEASPNWRGGSIPYNGGWHEARKLARKKSKGHCQICGKSEAENGRKLDTHHITKIRQFLMPDVAHNHKNLICLCRKCHASLHHPKGLSACLDASGLVSSSSQVPLLPH